MSAWTEEEIKRWEQQPQVQNANVRSELINRGHELKSIIENLDCQLGKVMLRARLDKTDREEEVKQLKTELKAAIEEQDDLRRMVAAFETARIPYFKPRDPWAKYSKVSF